MAGTVPAGLVLCKTCGRQVKGYRSTDWETTSPGVVAKVERVYPHRHHRLDTLQDCEGRYVATEPINART